MAAYFGSRFYSRTDQSAFLIGDTSYGHHQIEMACSACHVEPFGGKEILQDACMNCHGEELNDAHDSHPKSKFTDPRNADRVAILDARYCIACHAEHRREQTRPMGVTLPTDLCFHCHQDIAQDRPSHSGMAFDTCASAGCHNFHDNRALYEDFLVVHANEPYLKAIASIALADAAMLAARGDALQFADADAAQVVADHPDIGSEWAMSSHAAAGVNCSGCHQPAGGDWIEKPDHNACRDCHQGEVKGFLAGKHGMRLADELPRTLSPMSPMSPDASGMPFKATAHGRQQSCVACHGAHDFDPRPAAVEACLGCHNDSHSQAFTESPHFRLWQQEMAGGGEPGSGVSCASCHMPRHEVMLKGETRMAVEHNQNLNLRPNEKMIRPVCLQCHGLAFSIDALADPALIENNFKGRPARHIESIDMAVSRTRRNDH